LGVTLVIYQESLHDARSTKYKIILLYCRYFSAISPTTFVHSSNLGTSLNM